MMETKIPARLSFLILLLALSLVQQMGCAARNGVAKLTCDTDADGFCKESAASADQPIRRTLIGGNWKCNGNTALMEKIVTNINNAHDIPAQAEVTSCFILFYYLIMLLIIFVVNDYIFFLVCVICRSL